MSEVNWSATLADWECSERAQSESVSPQECAAVERALEWLGEHAFERIEYMRPLESKKILEADALSKNEVLSIAAQQIACHKRVHRTHLDQEHLKFRAYEMPFASSSDVLRYLKVKFKNDRQQLYSPSKINPVHISYHEDKKKLGVVRNEN